MESKQQHINAIEFAERWKDHGDEKQELLVIFKKCTTSYSKIYSVSVTQFFNI